MHFCRRTLLRMIGSALFGLPAICVHTPLWVAAKVCRSYRSRIRTLRSFTNPAKPSASPPTPSPHRSPRRPGRPRRPRLGRRYHPHRVRRRDLALIDRLWHAWSPSFTLDSARRAQERGLHHVGAGRFALALEARTLERGRNSSPVYNVSKLSPGISLGLLEPV